MRKTGAIQNHPKRVIEAMVLPSWTFLLKGTLSGPKPGCWGVLRKAITTMAARANRLRDQRLDGAVCRYSWEALDPGRYLRYKLVD